MGGKRVSSGILAQEGACYPVDLSWEGQGCVSTYAAQQTGTARVLGVHYHLSVHRCELLPQTVPTARQTPPQYKAARSCNLGSVPALQEIEQMQIM